MASLVVGIDLGTQSVKAVVCGPDLAVAGAGRVACAPVFPRPGWAEQDPAAWLDALAPAIAAALAAAGCAPADVAALAIAGQLDGMVAVDAAGAARGPCLIWLDRRATAEMPALDPARFLTTTGQVADASHLAAKARWWDRHHPGAAAFHQPVSFVVEALTGARVLDPGLASTTMLYDLDAAAWSPWLCQAFALEPARLPAIAPAHHVAGALTAVGAARTGLPAGLPVAVGTGDDFATPLGAGLAPGTLAVCVGTAEVVGALAPSPVRDGGRLVETHAYPGGGWFVEHPGWLSGGAVTGLGGLLGLDGEGVDAAAAAAPAGADGVGFLPALGGAMTPAWNPAVHGAFIGLTPGHGAPQLCRAVYEACAYAMRDVADRLAALGVPVTRARVLGGGAHARAWCRVRADVLGLPVERVAGADTCPIGAAVLAAVAAGWFADVATAAAALPVPVEVIDPDPDPAVAAVHARGHARYRALYEALAGLAARPGLS